MAMGEGIADGDQENANSGSRGGRSGEQGHNSQDTHMSTLSVPTDWQSIPGLTCSQAVEKLRGSLQGNEITHHRLQGNEITHHIAKEA